MEHATGGQLPERMFAQPEPITNPVEIDPGSLGSLLDSLVPGYLDIKTGSLINFSQIHDQNVKNKKVCLFGLKASRTSYILPMLNALTAVLRIP